MVRKLAGQRLRFWFNIFIPLRLDNYLIWLKKGPHQGKTVVPLPGMAYSVNPEKAKDLDWVGYLTDQRTFSSDPGASVRIGNVGSIDLGIYDDDVTAWENSHGRGSVMMNFHVGKKDRFESRIYTSGTVEVEIASGKETGRKNANLTSCKFSADPINDSPSQMMDKVTDRLYWINGAATDPLVRAAVPIVYSVAFRISMDPKKRTFTVGFEGSIGQFPAFEAYVKAFGKTQTLFQQGPVHGAKVTDLAFLNGVTVDAQPATFSYQSFIT